MNIAQMQLAVSMGQVARVLPDVDRQTGEPFYHLVNKFGQQIGRADVNAIPSLMEKTSNTIDWKDDGQGNYTALPKTTVSGPTIPGRTPTAVPVPAPRTAPSATHFAIWTGPTGNPEAGPISQAPPGSNPTLAGQMMQRDIMNARDNVQLLGKRAPVDAKGNFDPANAGVLQLIDSLDKDGKLGLLASRWNSFMTGVGTSPGDDPRIITLINKNMLGDTLTMLTHFGASGGRSPQMLQHFLDLANARKMDGPTLRAGTRAIADYMNDRAKWPSTKPAGNIIPKPGGGTFNWDNQPKSRAPGTR
jgi:hypothetical protein